MGPGIRGLLLATFICVSAGSVMAQESAFDVPAGSLKQALDIYARQAGVDLVYAVKDIGSAQSPGARGTLPPDDALRDVLAGTGFEGRRVDGAIGVTRIQYAQRPAQINPVAQTQASTSVSVAQVEEIIVTARKREETSLAVPVTLTAIGAGEIERRDLTNFNQIGHAVPQLQIASTFGSVQGGTVVLRGISSGESNPFADQSVSFNIDGAQVAISSVIRLGQLDMSQVEVLKGPQALFYGKNSPGGVISIHTADPGKTFAAKGEVGYETQARQWTAHGYVSGPVNDNVGVRLAVYGSTMRGWIKNVAQPTPTLTLQPAQPWLPGEKEIDGRATVTLKPSDRFDAKVKVAIGHVANADTNTSQYIACPSGHLQYGDAVQCGTGNTTVKERVAPSLLALSPLLGDGTPYSKSNQAFVTAEMNYALTEPLKLTSISSYYHTDYNTVNTQGNSLNPATTIANYTRFDVSQYTEELRVASSFDFPVNFLVGGFLQTADFHYRSLTYIGAITPIKNNDFLEVQHNHAYSGFAQLRWNVLPNLELSGGGRYSNETKKIDNFSGESISVTNKRPKDSWHDFSPEVTLSWRPTDHYTLYASYKQGFLSGGYNGGVVNLANDNHFDPQKIKGFEVGAKGLMADGALRSNVSFYQYKVTGLQVTTQLSAQQGFAQTVTNAGQSKVYGVDFDTAWSTPVPGLSAKGAIAYNHARYLVFNGACYRGQNVALGCNLFPNAAGVFTAQNLAGTPLLRAPDWAGSIGALYERPVTDDLKLELSVDGTYSGGYITLTQNSPQSRMKGFWLWDSGISLSSEQSKWQVRLMCRNCFDQYYWTRTAENSFSGSASGTTAPSVLSDDKAATGRGREIWIKVGIRY